MRIGQTRLGVLFGALALLVLTGVGALAADFETLMRDALVARSAGNYAAAEAGLKAALKIRPHDPRAIP